MAGRSRRELDVIRDTNRRALGLAGAEAPRWDARPDATLSTPGLGALSFTVPGGIMGMLPPVGIELAFPAVSAQWDPRSPTEPAQTSGSTIGQWATAHIFRPIVRVGNVPVNNYDGVADYSGIAKGIAVVLGVLGVGTGAYVVGKAFWPRRSA
jgi:hypothetical protein